MAFVHVRKKTFIKSKSAACLCFLFSLLFSLHAMSITIADSSRNTIQSNSSNKIGHAAKGSDVRLLSGLILRSYGLETKKANSYAAWIISASRKHDVPVLLLSGLIMTESSYRESAVSATGAVGLGQIKMRYWKKQCPLAAINSEKNVLCAALVLRSYWNTCGKDWSCALQTYNLGPGNYMRNRRLKDAGKRYLSKIYRYTKVIERELIKSSLASSVNWRMSKIYLASID